MADVEQIERLVEEAMRFLVVELAAERAMVTHLDGSHPDPVIQSCRGFEPDATWGTDEVCRQLLERLNQEGGPLVSDDPAPARGRSMVTAPLRHPSGRLVGFLYGDRGVEGGRYGARDLAALEVFARSYSLTLGELLSDEGPEQEAPSPGRDPGPDDALDEDLDGPLTFPQAGTMVALDGCTGRLIVDWL